MEKSITSNLYGWFASLLRRRIKSTSSDPNASGTTRTLAPATSSELISIQNVNPDIIPIEPRKLNAASKISCITKPPTMDAEPKPPTSNENSIEEEIEEVITDLSSDKSQSKSSKSASDKVVLKKRQLFDLDPGDQFAIDIDDELSGGIAKHFRAEQSDPVGPSPTRNDDEATVGSQRTEDDVSDLNDRSTLYVKSLELKESILNVDPRDCLSLDSAVRVLQPRASPTDLNDSFERDNSQEEVIESNHSIEMTLDQNEMSSLDPNIDIDNESQINRILGDSQESSSKSPSKAQTVSKDKSPSRSENVPQSQKSSRAEISENTPANVDHSETDESDMSDLKQKILELPPSKKESSGPLLKRDISFEQTDDQGIVVKRMERVEGADVSKEALDDITEESEKISSHELEKQPSLDRDSDRLSPEKDNFASPLHMDNDNTSNDFDSIISLNMIQMLENKVKDLQEIVEGKDACLSSLNMQLDAVHRRESFANAETRDSSRDLPPSGRDSSSLATTSTEYRTIQEDIPRVFDFHSELAQRDLIIGKLTDSLQQSMLIREQLQTQSDKFALEVQQLRKQLTETLETIKRPYWPRDHESSITGQRLSEISIDLVSESDDDLERQFLTDNEEKVSVSNRNSRERQLLADTSGSSVYENFDPEMLCVSKQIEQFQKYLNTDELRIFFMVQKKFDDFLSQEVEKVKMKHDTEVKSVVEQLENEKCEKEIEINRLRKLLTSVKNGSTELVQLRHELEAIHSLEMEKLRTYFEKKCADLEKHYSEEVFSQKSQRNSADSSSELSDQEMHEDHLIPPLPITKAEIVKKRSLEDLISSPIHRQLTPTLGELLNEKEPDIPPEELKTFYKEKIGEISHRYDENIKRLKDRLRRLESKYADDEFMRISAEDQSSVIGHHHGSFLGGGGDTSSYMIFDRDDVINESQEIRKIAAEYERRLQEQIGLAKQDLVHELEKQIQALLSETTTDDNHWPPELILLREKFTAKSQLEIAQLQIKHEEEMSRLKSDYEKQLNRKNKRNLTFDSARDLQQIVLERDNLRELSNTFRYLLYELAKCVSVCEDDLNSTIVEELQKHGILTDHNVSEAGDADNLNLSTQSNQQLQATLTKKLRLVPNVSGLLSVIEDPTLIDFIRDNSGDLSEFQLKDCLDKLKSEANCLLELSEKLCKGENKSDESGGEKRDSCEEEDGLKVVGLKRATKLDRAISLQDNILREPQQSEPQTPPLSLPAEISGLEISIDPPCSEDIYSSALSPNELSVRLNEVQNRLVKSETERTKLRDELQITINRNNDLGVELNALRDQLRTLDSSNREDLSEGYGINDLQSPPRLRSKQNASTSFSQLQDKARNLLSTPTKTMSDNTALLLQLVEEFCREGDHVLEDSRQDRDDLQAQIDAADKKLKDTRQFLDLQAADREAERDEFVKEIEKLKMQIREKEKERSSFELASKEFEQMDQQIRDLTHQVGHHEEQRDRLESDLKASIDKIFVLREIITDLELQVDSKSLNETVLNEKVKELEAFIASQARSNETLQNEVESLKTEIGHGYQERIAQLEEQLRNTRSNSEQNLAIEHLTEQLRDIETTLDQKTKILESLHAAGSNSCSENLSEDISAQNLPKDINPPTPQASPINTPRHHSLPIDEVQRVFQKLSKHTRVEEAAIKRIRDLEMHVGNIRTSYTELENERKLLQDKMSEQVVRISSLQSKLDEQRRRAEELNRQGTSDFAIRIHDLQSEVFNLKETLSARDKQIANLKNHLEQSKKIIDRHEAELAVTIQGDSGRVAQLETELKSKTDEVNKLREKTKKEMINKLALPDLMETMLADKNEEIDHLKEQLEQKDRELQAILNINLAQNDNNSSKEKDKSQEPSDGSKGSARTLSDIVSISDFDEPDVIRRAATGADTQLELPQGNFPEKTMESSKCATANLTDKRSDDVSPFGLPTSNALLRTFDQPNFFMASSSSKNNNTTPSFAPRQINFSEFVEDFKIKESTPKIVEITDTDDIESLRELVKTTEERAESLKISLEAVESEKAVEIDRLNAELKAKCELCDQMLKEKEELETKIQLASEELAKTAKLVADLKLKADLLEEVQRSQVESRTKIEELEKVVEAKLAEIVSLKEEIESKEPNLKDSIEDFNMNKQIERLTDAVKEKDERLSKTEKDLLNSKQNEKQLLERIAQIEQEKVTIAAELDAIRAEFSEKVLLYEKSLLDFETYKAKFEALERDISERVKEVMDAQPAAADIVNGLRKKIQALEEHNASLTSELERLRSQSDNSKPYSLDEIAEKVEKELNYSAQLDSNILKAIESEDETNLDLHFKTDSNKPAEDNLIGQLEALKRQLEAERDSSKQLLQQLTEVRLQIQDVQEQDADIIEALRVRLEEAIEKESDLHRILEEERDKCERLTSQLSVLQRSEARKSTMASRTPPDSPRKAARAAEEADAAERLKEEIKMVTAQNERERERVNDLQKVLEREKVRFEKELAERVDYAEKLKREMDKVKHDKNLADEEVEHLQERLTAASREIESLEGRISTLQEAETRRAYRRGKERTETTQNAVDIQEMRAKITHLEAERDHLTEVVKMLRDDVDRGAQREAKLAEALANAGTDNSIPEQFMQKLKEMNYLLAENAKENRQMAETLQYLTDERKMLQRRCEELESNCQTGALAATTLTEMEERANHLFGKYLRVESHRKALVHQKRYLMIVLQSYQDNEAKALSMLNCGEPRRKKPYSFKSVALIVIAIERMKFIVRRWQSGKVVVSKSIFNLAMQKRAPSAIAGNGTQRQAKHGLTSLSPPCRDRPLAERQNLVLGGNFRPLQAPGLISECSDKLDWTNRWKSSKARVD